MALSGGGHSGRLRPGGDAVTQELEEGRRRVPFGVWVVAALTVLLSLLLLLDATGIRPSNSASIIMRLGGQGGLISWVIGGVAVLGFALAIALLRLLQVGLVGTILLAGVGLLNELLSRVVYHSADDARLLILVVAVIYLNTRPVRIAFQREGPGRATVTARGAEGE
jgi:hypothetical protein